MSDKSDEQYGQLKAEYDAGTASGSLLPLMAEIPALAPVQIKETLAAFEVFFQHPHSSLPVHNQLDEARARYELSPRELRNIETARLKDLERTRTDPGQESLRKILVGLEGLRKDSDPSVVRADFFQGAQDRRECDERRLAEVTEIKDKALSHIQYETVRSLLGTGDGAWSPMSRNAISALSQLEGGTAIAQKAASLSTALSQIAYLKNHGMTLEASVAAVVPQSATLAIKPGGPGGM